MTRAGRKMRDSEARDPRLRPVMRLENLPQHERAIAEAETVVKMNYLAEREAWAREVRAVLAIRRVFAVLAALSGTDPSRA